MTEPHATRKPSRKWGLVVVLAIVAALPFVPAVRDFCGFICFIASLKSSRGVLDSYPSPNGAWVLEIGSTDCGAMDNFHFDGTLVDTTGRSEPVRLFFDPKGTYDIEVRWIDDHNVEIEATWPKGFPITTYSVGDVRAKIVQRE